MKGGELVGDWTDVETLREVMYFTWGDNIGLAEELLRIIQTYDVRLVMSGHVHRDMIYILNGENYFVTTGNSGGGVGLRVTRGRVRGSSSWIPLAPFVSASTLRRGSSIPLMRSRRGSSPTITGERTTGRGRLSQRGL